VKIIEVSCFFYKKLYKKGGDGVIDKESKEKELKWKV
jgi:hypothetical protein